MNRLTAWIITACVITCISANVISTVMLNDKIESLQKTTSDVSMDSHSENNLQDIKLKTLVERYNDQKKVVSQEIDNLMAIKKEMGVDWSF